MQNNIIKPNTIQLNAKIIQKYKKTQYIQYNKTKYETFQSIIIQYNAMHFSIIQYNVFQYNIIQYSIGQYIRLQ